MNEEALVEVELARIAIRETGPEQYVFLKEKNGDRIFPIVIGIFEAIAINREVRGEKPERPMTHDLLLSVIKHLGAEVEKIVVTDLKDGTFYANIHIRTKEGEVVVDARPSDAMALAVRSGSPIFAAEKVLQQVASSPEENEQ